MMENQNYPTEASKGKFDWTVPVSVIIAGLLISGAIIYNQKNGTPNADIGNGIKKDINEELTKIDNVRAIGPNDHILGNPDAPIKIIEFSDLECPFCKRFHPTMKQIIDEYGQNGQVAWVYRHFPLDALHSKARKEAEATECANELGGNNKFWAYLDRLFEVTPSNNNLDLAELPNIAEFIGLDRAKFEQCLASGKYAQHIADDLADATNSGAQGTPYSILIAPDGQKYPVNGAIPYAQVKTLIEQALR